MCSLSIYSPRVFEVFIFKFVKSKVSHNSHMLESNFIHQYIVTTNRFWLYGVALKLNSDIKRKRDKNLALCYWNVNSISANNYIKISLLRTYISTHKFDVIYISETYFDSGQSKS